MFQRIYFLADKYKKKTFENFWKIVREIEILMFFQSELLQQKLHKFGSMKIALQYVNDINGNTQAVQLPLTECNDL